MEGIARYVHIRSAEAAEHNQPSPEYTVLPDYQSCETYAREARSDTLSELKKADLATWKRTLVYSFGRFRSRPLAPKWKQRYFRQLFTLDLYFENQP